MKINYEKTKIDNFYKMLKSHPFDEYKGLTNKYKGFEIPNLTEDLKIQMLKKLNPANRLETPDFNSFWDWYRKNMGMKTAALFSKYLYPSMGKEYNGLINCMRNNKNHEFWEHIRARIYKKWCSIITETQCVYAILTHLEKSGKNWEISSSAELDGIGIDFVILTSVAIPVQIKKISFSRIAQKKKNNDENFSKFTLSNRAQNVLNQELVKLGKDYKIDNGVLVKYGLKTNNEFPYSYLQEYENGFVYFDGEELVSQLEEIIR